MTHRVRFLKLQLHLLEDFRIRLVQVMQGFIHEPLCDTFCAIVNAVYYVTEVLQEWNNLPVSDGGTDRLSHTINSVGPYIRTLIFYRNKDVGLLALFNLIAELG